MNCQHRVGVNVSAGFHVAIKNSDTDTPIIFSVSDYLSFGSASGSFIGSFIHTDWFEIDTRVSPLFEDPRALIGRHLGILVSGTLVTSGTVDVKFESYDRYGHAQTILNIVDIKAKGMKIASSSARGVARRWAVQLVEKARIQEAQSPAIAVPN